MPWQRGTTLGPGSNVVDLTDAELTAVIGWAAADAIGFSFGPANPNPKDPSISALAKFEALKRA